MMTTEELINKVKKMDYPQELDKSYEGSCPCFWYKPIIDGRKIEIHGHCWRTNIDGCNCSFNGLHITGSLSVAKLTKIAKTFKKQLDKQNWYSSYQLVIKSTLKEDEEKKVSKNKYNSRECITRDVKNLLKAASIGITKKDIIFNLETILEKLEYKI